MKNIIIAITHPIIQSPS